VLRFDGSYVDEATLDRLIRRCRTATYDPREPLTSAVLVEAVAAGRLREHQDGAALVEALAGRSRSLVRRNGCEALADQHRAGGCRFDGDPVLG
jgi:hypothetical protein